MRISGFKSVLVFCTLFLAEPLVAGPALDFGQTLRVDYTFCGNFSRQEIYLDELCSFEGWAGRRHNLDSLLLKGNGQISLWSMEGELLYINSFSTLFQEWLTSEEAQSRSRSFEEVFLLPMPVEKSLVRVELFSHKGQSSVRFEHVVDPADILIRRLHPFQAPVRELLASGSPDECIDVVILAEGYTAAEQELFWADAQTAMEQILAHEPFASYRNKFNFRAVALESAHSGVSVPQEGLWKNTALSSHFGTFYMDRYLTTLRLRKLHDCLVGVPYEHIIILANTDTYGGGGIYGNYTLTTAHHKMFKPVVVHEFGHSFCGLADEYYYDDQYEQYYFSGIEPWERNITTLADFASKWQDMLPGASVSGCGKDVPFEISADGRGDGSRTALSSSGQGEDSLAALSASGQDDGSRTALSADELWKRIAAGEDASSFVGLYEGGGYLSKGVWRGFPDCRMKTNSAPAFCPVCQRAIREFIEYNL